MKEGSYVKIRVRFVFPAPPIDPWGPFKGILNPTLNSLLLLTLTSRTSVSVANSSHYNSNLIAILSLGIIVKSKLLMSYLESAPKN